MLSQNTRLSYLSHTANSHWLSILLIHIVIYMSQCYSVNSFHPILPLLCPQIYSLCLYLYCYCTNRFIRTIFLGFLGDASGKEPSCQCRKHKRHRFDPWEDILEEEIATHSSILAWRIPWTEECGGLQSEGHKELDVILHAEYHFYRFHIHVLMYDICFSLSDLLHSV